MSTEIASAYVALYARMPGVQKDIQDQLGGVDFDGQGKRAGGKFSSALAGAVGGAMAAVTGRVINSVMGSVDAAISRVDTINNFPKIMANLGYESDEAAASIATMSERLTGLPTALDKMAGITQQLAPLTGGLEEATDLSLALNNALLAGGKPAEQQANAMEQYTQMLAVGKPDMAAWRSMVTAMPGQMDQLAQSLLGASAGSMDLYEAMKNGTVSFDDFNAAVLELNETGTGEFASFAQQAMDATDGIATSQANLQTAVTRGLADIIMEAEPLLKMLIEGGTQLANAVFPLIAEAIGWVVQALDGVDVAALFDMAGAFSPMLHIFEVLQPVLPVIVDLLMQLGEALAAGVLAVMDVLAPILTTIATVLVDLAAQIVPMLLPIIVELAEIFAELIAAAAPMVEMILPLIVELFEELTPVIMQVIEAVLPLIESVMTLVEPLMDLVMQILPLLIELFTAFLPPILNLVDGLLNFLIPVIMGVVDAITNFLGPVIEGITTILGGVLDFIVGVFTGDWERAWEGIVQIFQGIWDTVQSIARGAINFIIDLINGVIGGINSVAGGISDLTGGAISLSVPTIPRLASGGIVQARPGGIIANVGEGRYDEAVVPLDEKFYAALGGGSGPRELVVVDADRALIGRMRVESEGVVVDSLRDGDKRRLRDELGVR